MSFSFLTFPICQHNPIALATAEPSSCTPQAIGLPEKLQLLPAGSASLTPQKRDWSATKLIHKIPQQHCLQPSTLLFLLPGSSVTFLLAFPCPWLNVTAPSNNYFLCCVPPLGTAIRHYLLDTSYSLFTAQTPAEEQKQMHPSGSSVPPSENKARSNSRLRALLLTLGDEALRSSIPGATASNNLQTSAGGLGIYSCFADAWGGSPGAQLRRRAPQPPRQ